MAGVRFVSKKRGFWLDYLTGGNRGSRENPFIKEWYVRSFRRDAETNARDGRAPQSRSGAREFAASTVQRFNDSTVQRFNDSTIQRFNDLTLPTAVNAGGMAAAVAIICVGREREEREVLPVKVVL